MFPESLASTFWFVNTLIFCCGRSDPGSGAFLTPQIGIRDGQNQIWDPVAGINILDYISESLVSTFWVKNTLFFFPEPSGIQFLSDPGSGMERFGPEIGDKHPGSVVFN
jgi:hypothetical protein